MDISKIIVNEELSVRDALRILDSTAKKALFVVKENKMIGSVSDGDVRRWILKNGDLYEPVKSVMNKEPIYITEKDKMKAVAIMKKQGIAAIPLLNAAGEILDVYFWAEDDDISGEDKLNLDVIIMAGGKGERLLPYTSVVPKPLIPVGDKPIVELIIDSFLKYGCNDFSLSINYKKNMIKAYFEELERDYRVSYIEEEKPLGTAGSLYYYKDHVKDTFFVSNCDILLNVNYSDVYKYHRQNKNLITLITTLKHIVVPYGIININEGGNLHSLIEKPSLNYLINTGVYLLEPSALDYIKQNVFTNITDLIEECLQAGERIGTYPISEEAWMDMGQFEELEKMKADLQR